MAINLTKGQTINLDKSTNDLSSITIGLGWKIKQKGGFLSKMFSSTDDFDLDAIAVLLNENGKIGTLGDQRLQGGDVIFFNNLRHHTGYVVHSGDNIVGGAGVKDDEQIVVKLNSLPEVYQRIIFIVAIYQGVQKKQHFGQVETAFMRAVDAKGNEIGRYDLAEDPGSENMRTMVFGEVYRKGGDWKFRATGEPYPTDSFVDIVKQYIS